MVEIRKYTYKFKISCNLPDHVVFMPVEELKHRNDEMSLVSIKKENNLYLLNRSKQVNDDWLMICFSYTYTYAWSADQTRVATKRRSSATQVIFHADWFVFNNCPIS
jgi:hypothetical protein